MASSSLCKPTPPRWVFLSCNIIWEQFQPAHCFENKCNCFLPICRFPSTDVRIIQSYLQDPQSFSARLFFNVALRVRRDYYPHCVKKWEGTDQAHTAGVSNREPWVFSPLPQKLHVLSLSMCPVVIWEPPSQTFLTGALTDLSEPSLGRELPASWGSSPRHHWVVLLVTSLPVTLTHRV